jgi:tRNA threonylcarbamoyl adenosine modification protein (Sua5/YciO/YrdC/YwlC family)
MILAVDTHEPEAKLVRRAVEVLRRGGIIAYPTDTVYGIGCDLFNKKSIERVYQIKRIPKYKQLSFICSDLKEISRYAQVGNFAYRMMKRLLPGPYTFILAATRVVPKMMLTKRRTVGIRVPDNEIVLSIVRELGNPIISTSASLYKDEILSEPDEIEKNFGPSLDLIIDGGPLVSELSSVVDLSGEPPIVIREGKGDISLFLS